MSDVWLTPKPIIDALGPFDLDPCAAPEPRPWPTAARHIVLPEDGLAAEWTGLVWLNPPYAEKAEAWLAKLGSHLPGGIALILARTETEWWFKTIWERAAGMLFLRGRLHFHYRDGSRAKGNCGAPPVLIGYQDEAMRRLACCDLPGHLVVNAPLLILGPNAPTTWREVIQQAMDGEAKPLRDIYAVASATAKARIAITRGVKWREKVRKVLQAYFRPVARGVWAPA